MRYIGLFPLKPTQSLVGIVRPEEGFCMSVISDNIGEADATQTSVVRNKKRTTQTHDQYIDIDFQLKEIVSINGGGSIYNISFCDIIPSLWTYFAAVGGRSASLFSIDADDSIRSIRTYTSEDRGDEFYARCLLLEHY